MAHISIPIKTVTQCAKIVSKAIEKGNTWDQRKLEIATSAISVYDTFEDEICRHYKSVVSH